MNRKSMNRKSMSKTSFTAAFERLLVALETEILAMSDEEITEVLAERGMKLGMKGSASLIDLIDPRSTAASEPDADGAEDGVVAPLLPLVPRRQ